MNTDEAEWADTVEQAVNHSEFAHSANESMIRQHLLASASNSRRRITGVLPLLPQPLSQMCVLDIGCGSGAASAALCDLGAQCVIGFDLSRDVLGIDLAVQRSRLIKRPLNLMLANGYHLPFADESFDLGWCEFVVEHVACLDVLLRETWRVLRPGGLLYVVTNNAWWPIEAHSQLWWASWLPSKVAAGYARWRKHWPADREWDIYLYSRRALHRYIHHARFEMTATAVELLTGKGRRWLDRGALLRWKAFELVMPNLYVLARKPVGA
jgi:SAM-dependent methyltransferase